MKYLFTGLLSLCFLFIFYAATGVKDSKAVVSQKVQYDLLEKMTEEGDSQTYDVLIKMQAQAELNKALLFDTKEEKGAYVYETLTALALETQADLVSQLEAQGLKVKRFYIVNMIGVKNVSLDLIKKIAERDDVAKVYGNFQLKNIEPRPTPFMEPLTEPTGVGPNIAYTKADKVWLQYGVRGENIVIAGQDTGIEWDHPALISHYRGKTANGVDHNYNWYDAIKEPIPGGGGTCGYNKQEPCDDNDHGTHTVGTIVGDDGQGNQIGMAPGATWIGCRNMDAGVGRPTTYMDCFQFFLAPFPLGGDALTDGDPAMAPHVINNSWGCPDSEKCQGDVMLEVLRSLKAAGIFVVVSAGNEGSACSTIQDTPAWHTEDTFSVGAINDANGQIAGFSSRGPSKFDGGLGPDVVAPGVNVRSSVRGKKYTGFFWSGTSMAGPHVVGLVALMWSANPELIGKIDETAQIIKATTTPIESSACMPDGVSQSPNNTYGYGMINAVKAVETALQR